MEQNIGILGFGLLINQPLQEKINLTFVIQCIVKE